VRYPNLARSWITALAGNILRHSHDREDTITSLQVIRDSKNVYHPRLSRYQLMTAAERHHSHRNLLPGQRTNSARCQESQAYQAYGVIWNLGPQFLRRMKDYMLLS